MKVNIFDLAHTTLLFSAAMLILGETVFAQSDIVWTKTFGGRVEDKDGTVHEMPDGGFILAGKTDSFGAGSADAWLIGTDSSGDTLWTRTYGGTGFEWAYSVQQTSDGGFVFGGATSSFGAGDFDVWLIRIGPDVVGVKEEQVGLPDKFSLVENHPNPFNPTTTIRYDLPERSHVSVSIYDLLGRQVRALVNDTQQAGFHSVSWDGTDDSGQLVSAGIYLYQIQAGTFTETRRMMLLR